MRCRCFVCAAISIIVVSLQPRILTILYYNVLSFLFALLFVHRYVRNLPYTITNEELYAIFGKYGAVYQIRLGDRDKDTRGTAFVVYEDIYDAKAAVDHLSGFQVGGRYLVVLYYQPQKFEKRAQLQEKEEELQELRKRVEKHKATLKK